jgi:hypothetical protein
MGSNPDAQGSVACGKLTAAMDAITITLVSAFTIGASKGAAKVGEQAIVDAYAALKHIVERTYQRANELLKAIAALETNPESPARRHVLAEELEAVNATTDETLIEAAESVIAAAESAESRETIGIDWENVRAARLKLGQIHARAGAIGFRAARMEILGDIEIAGIDVDGSPGK